MNDPIEEALQRMKPAELPPALMARLTAARPQGAARTEAAPASAGWLSLLRQWLLPVGVCAVVAVATVTYLNSTPSGPSGKSAQGNPSSGGGIASNQGAAGGAMPVSAPVPFQSEDRFVGAREVGLVVPPNQRPIRLMELEWLESNTLAPHAGGDAVRVETRRREVVPMALDIY